MCAPGYELDGDNMCAACNISYYNPNIDGDCIRCENGTTTERTGANMTSDCGRYRCQNIFYLWYDIMSVVQFLFFDTKSVSLHLD